VSRAFVSEDDTCPEQDVPEIRIPLPPGAKNYVTPEGGARLREELAALELGERPKLAAAVARMVREADRDSAAVEVTRRRLREVQRRIEYLNSMIARMEIVEPGEAAGSGGGGLARVQFGARVTVRQPGAESRVFRIVGVDESDPAAGLISWISPLARAVTGAAVGDKVSVELPEGGSVFEILAIDPTGA
jgi:transcription elongation factor GreB